ncbi:hypothetical protein PG995_010396 [Apiospora arundinis]
MEPIAIVGLSFRLPQGIEDTSTLWDTLEKGKNVMTPWPEDRTSIRGFYEADTSKINRLHSIGGHFIGGNLGEFDAPFFSINSKEAAAMDPQQHLLLETSYRALENAGISLCKVAGTATGVFVGSMSDDYSRIGSKDPDEAPVHAATGQCMGLLANRLSWVFDLKGPSMQVNTACSSSMIATDLAYGDMIRAVIRATGSNQDGHTPGITQPNVASQEDLIRTVYKSCDLGFESTVYVESHGTGTQLGDFCEAKALGQVFKSSRSSNNPLYMQVMSDPLVYLFLELTNLNRGSVKANIGHVEGGSGLAGMLKSVLMLEKGIIPPNALFERLNPKINAKALNIQVPTSCISWPSEGLRRISVNSFGFGGSNGHAILDDAYHCLQELGLKGIHQTQIPSGRPTQVQPRFDEKYSTHCSDRKAGQVVNDNNLSVASSAIASASRILVWSAKDEDALKRMTKNYAVFMETRTPNLNQIAYTLAVKRSRLAWRSFAVVGAGAPILPAKLPFVRSFRDVALAFVFTGQGAQYAGMGLELLSYSAFRSTLEATNAAFQSLGATWSLYDAMLDEDRISDPQLSQPLCTALQLGLVELLRSFGIVPTAVIGHSSGEIAAAYTLGALSLESACKVAYHRGRLAAQLGGTSPGAMISVNMPEQQVYSYLDDISIEEGQLHIACINSPFNVTLSGNEASIDTLKRHLDQDNIFARKLTTGVAYHTPLMKNIASDSPG